MLHPRPRYHAGIIGATPSPLSHSPFAYQTQHVTSASPFDDVRRFFYGADTAPSPLPSVLRSPTFFQDAHDTTAQTPIPIPLTPSPILFLLPPPSPPVILTNDNITPTLRGRMRKRSQQVRSPSVAVLSAHGISDPTVSSPLASAAVLLSTASTFTLCAASLAATELRLLDDNIRANAHKRAPSQAHSAQQRRIRQRGGHVLARTFPLRQRIRTRSTRANILE